MRLGHRARKHQTTCSTCRRLEVAVRGRRSAEEQERRRYADVKEYGLEIATARAKNAASPYEVELGHVASRRSELHGESLRGSKKGGSLPTARHHEARQAWHT